MPKITTYMREPFEINGKISLWIAGAFLLVNGIVLFNACRHAPYIGYDSFAHIQYYNVLAHHRFPTPAETKEFFCPPLPYIVPALFEALTSWHRFMVMRTALLFNFLCSVGLTFYMLRIGHAIRPSDKVFKTGALLLLGMMPVYYKTFAFIRGEPLLAFCIVLVVYKTLKIFLHGETRARDILIYGVSLGAVILSRQSGFLIFPAVIIFVLMIISKKPSVIRGHVRILGLSFLIALLCGGWFYRHLQSTYSSFKIFSQTPSKFSLANQPPHFYFGTGDGKLFIDPVRDAFANQMLPMFYSEFWGDYGCYFLIFVREKETGRFYSAGNLKRRLTGESLPDHLISNRYEMGRYLGRVNLVSLFPSLVFMAGILTSCLAFGHFASRREIDLLKASYGLFFLTIAFMCLGYFYFLIIFPDQIHGNSIKASYLLPLYPLVALCAMEFLMHIKRMSKTAFYAVAVVMLLVALHNAPTYFTHYHN